MSLLEKLMIKKTVDEPLINTNININAKLQVYLAGPDVFMPNCIDIGNYKKQLLAAAGYIGHFPLDPLIPDFKPNQETAYNISKGNETSMDQCQIILANMTPWHGSPSMDVGTAFEVGYMSCKAKFRPLDTLIIGYYEGDVEQDYSKRVAQYYNHQIIEQKDGRVTDITGVTLENFTLCENLMIPAAIKKTGGDIFLSFEEAVNNISLLWKSKACIAKNAY
ncbi:MAG: nucleoside 2-deoxyribosyltransferase [Legionella sp.]|nr:nucleoside 2-deoxyribosyltransferase [Legionella sp.]